MEEKERAPERREGKESAGAKQWNADKNARSHSCRETNKSGVQNNKRNAAADFFTLF
jgi:hypothetical protein